MKNNLADQFVVNNSIVRKGLGKTSISDKEQKL